MLELIYIIADADCAAARKAAVASGKEIQFRNLYYPEVKADYDARGGTKLPAISSPNPGHVSHDVSGP